MTTPILYDSHMHTPLCKHARGNPTKYAAQAEKRGLKGVIFTCHNPIPGGHSAWLRMAVDQFDIYIALIEKTRQEWAGRVDVRLGLECDFYPGAESWLAELLARAEFHHILGSVHPGIREYRTIYDKGNPLAFQRTYFEHLALAAETGLFDTLSHPDLVKNLYRYSWDINAVLPDICVSLDRIARTNVALELNTSGLHKEIPEMNPAPAMLIEMRERDIPVIVNSDAHEPRRVAADFEKAFDLLLEVGYTQISQFLNRERYTLDINEAKATLQ